MKFNKTLKIAAAALALAANTAFAGTITNGNFAANLSGWSANGYVSVQNNGTYNYADLFAGLGAGAYTTLSQSISLNAGDVLTGYAQFFAHDYVPFNDDAFVSINGTNLFYSNIPMVGNYGTGDLTQFTFTALTSGVYSLVAGVANQGDNGLASELQISNFSIASNDVPEPASLALLGLGLLGMSAARRKDKKA